MKYITKFTDHAAYSAAESSLVEPNVSYCVNENEVHYKPIPSAPQHDYVEIGGIKWATMNIGANSITDTGLYFQWGDTQGYTASQIGNGSGQKPFDDIDWIDYRFTPNGIDWDDEPDYGITKYTNADGLITLQLSDDAVNAAWGGNWRMPTQAEFQALGTATTSAWTADYEGSGVAGLVLTSNADSSKKLFFPAVGVAMNGSVENVGSIGCYWSSSLYSGDVYGAYLLRFSIQNADCVDESRICGFLVRGVFDEGL